MSQAQHLTPGQVGEILRIVQEDEPIVVGGQAINLWARLYRLDAENGGTFTSKDIDFFAHPEAVRRLADGLEGGAVHTPDKADPSPNSALVRGSIDGRALDVDFLRVVVGVDERVLRSRAVTLSIGGHDGAPMRVAIMHPLDCLRSRLANLNVLGRRGEHATVQARTSVRVVASFLEDSLRRGAIREAQEALVELEAIGREHCVRHPARLVHGVDVVPTMRRFLSDARLDPRWRSAILERAISRLVSRQRSAEAAAVPEHPVGTHGIRISADGRTVVVRKIGKDGKPSCVDNPIGPAVVSPGNERFALDGRFFRDERDWRQALDARPRPPGP